ncbi:MAG: hypothetical protein CHACPFDD_02366 [Phycisphaerae bacterium]|nr:hypothetical protein [Phycisphaerae bacterium]
MTGRARFAALLGAITLTSGAAAEITIRDPGTYVVDRAQIVDPGVEQQLEGWLRDLEQKTGAQLKVLSVTSTDGEDPFQFGHRHAELWKLGQRGKDNGALVIVVVEARKVFIHTGYGLEATLPDSWCGSLSRDVFAEHFRRQRYSDGILTGTVMIANKIAESAGVQLSGMPNYRHVLSSGRARGRGSRAPGATCAGALPVLFFVILLAGARARRRYRSRWGGSSGVAEALLWNVLFNVLASGGRGRRGGGGSWGGGGGSFGGGGRFGGGGGGASW